MTALCLDFFCELIIIIVVSLQFCSKNFNTQSNWHGVFSYYLLSKILLLLLLLLLLFYE